MSHGKCSDQVQAQLMFELLIIDFHPEENLIPSGPTAPSVPPNRRSHETLTGHLTLGIHFLIYFSALGSGYDYSHVTEEKTKA